eukprot:2426823-Lingulodinium_polyedra.AAC.1
METDCEKNDRIRLTRVPTGTNIDLGGARGLWGTCPPVLSAVVVFVCKRRYRTYAQLCRRGAI